MTKQHYFFKLIPPRPTFPQDISPAETLLMQEHAQYFLQHFTAGTVLAYGPVLAPGAAFGFAVLEVADESAARAFGENDPSVKASLNRFEIYPMRLTGAQGSRS
jgi:uncharacterized protein YciI